MASKILNVLTDVEQGRQLCLSGFNSKGVSVDSNASFKTMWYYINQLNKYPIEDSTAPPDKEHEGFNYTHETDPTLWRRPNDWPDIEAIFKTYDNTTLNNQTMIPWQIILLKNDPNDTIRIREYSSNYKNKDNIVSGDILFGGTATANPFTYKDGAQFIFSDDPTHSLDFPGGVESYDGYSQSHTWDQTQDIVVGEDHYRWILMKTSIAYLVRDCVDVTHVNAVESICTDTFPGHLNVSLIFEHLKIIKQFVNNGGAVSNNVTTLNTDNALSPYYFQNKLRCFELSEDCRRTVGLSIHTLASIYPCLTDYYLPTRTANNPNTDDCLNATYFPKLTYLRLKKVVLITASGAASNAYSYGASGINNIAPVKYVLVDDESQSSQTHMTQFPQWPYIVEENVTKYITSVEYGYNNTGYNTVGNYAAYSKTIYLPNVTSVQSCVFPYNKATNIILPKYKATTPSNITGNGTQIGTGTLVSKLVLGTEEITSNFIANTSYINSSLRYIGFPKLHTVSAGFYNLASNVTLYAPVSLYIDVPALTNLTVATAFNHYYTRYLSLPNNFKYNLTLSSCTYLDPECARDILNKCAQLDEEESYTITFKNKVRSAVMDLIPQAEEKGWTITFVS